MRNREPFSEVCRAERCRNPSRATGMPAYWKIRRHSSRAARGRPTIATCAKPDKIPEACVPEPNYGPKRRIRSPRSEHYRPGAPQELAAAPLLTLKRPEQVDPTASSLALTIGQ